MKNKTNVNKIEFYSWSDLAENVSKMPSLAKSHIPASWKEKPRYVGSEELMLYGKDDSGNAVPNTGLKHCIPYFDAMTAGYVQELHCDIQITIKNGEQYAKWRSPLNPIQVRNPDEIDSSLGYSSKHFAWLMQWGIKTPPGWSCLLTSPMNRPELPFITPSAIMDTDHYSSPGNISFHLKDGFEGIILAGTPIYQIIPIKREAWVSEKNLSLRSEGQKEQEKRMNFFSGFYKKERWQKKEYS